MNKGQSILRKGIERLMIYVTGDLHGEIDISKLNTKNFPQQKNLTKDDYVIILGDFGLLWNDSKQEYYWRKWLDEKPWTTLFVDGNHESFDLLDNFPIEIWNGGKIHRINDSIIHLMRGQIFNIDGKKFFTFGGANTTDKEDRKEGKSWWAREMPSKEEMQEGINNLRDTNWQIDYILTHCCCNKILGIIEDYKNKLEEEKEKRFKSLGYNFKEKPKFKYEIDDLNKYFNLIGEKIIFKHWYFGHYHIDIKNIIEKQTVVFKDIIKL